MSGNDKLTCHEVSRILSDGLDADMAPAERARLRLHLVICEACRNVEQQFELLRRLVRREPPDDTDDTDLRDDKPDDKAR